MPGSRTPSYGYRDADVANLSLPPLITCERCNKKKAHRNFAKKRQLDAKLNLSKGKGAKAICMLCTGSPIKELECIVCDTWKALDDYAKAQRKNPDCATCEKCMKNQLETEPIEVGGARGYDDDSDDEDGAGCTMDAPTLPGESEGLSVDLLGLCIGEKGEGNGNGVKQSGHASPAVKSPGGQSASGGVPLTYGFNPKAYSSRASSTINSMANNPPASKNSNFAKVGAYKAPKPKKEEKKEEKKDSDSESWHGQQEDDEELDEDEI
ncbi:uncharacterized protein BKA78DRAFT_376455 [Phyllosticta capitalensis]|uniref:Stc1 domain-containing protein n=1 Tax=Phyllosticta capitalensis TaxID=121624 RepID=A0ABR1Z5G4_9PEZI